MRTKIGIDISNNEKSHPQTHNEEAVQEEIRESIATQLKENRCDDIPIFLIDNLEPNKFEFEKLKLKLIEDFPELKKAALILSIQSWEKDIVKFKVAELRRRIWKKALLSSAVAAVPIPGLSLAADMAMVRHEADFYFKRLNLDDKSLHRYAKLYSADYNKMKSVINKEMKALEGIKELIKTAAVPTIVVSSLALIAAKIFLPLAVIGNMISVPLSFKGTYSTLKFVLDTYEKVAIEVAKEVAGSADSVAAIEEMEATISQDRRSDSAPEESLKVGVEESTVVTR